MASTREKLRQLFQGEIAKPCRNLQIAQNHKFVSDLGKGNPESMVIFCGEAPGEKEDESGHPFIGRAGKFFNESLKTIGLKREQIWVSNIVKFRPTENKTRNRKPTKKEIKACLPILKKEIEIIDPKIIVALGSIALHALTGRKYKINEVSGQKMSYDGRILLPTYHPSAVMRFKKYKMQYQEDFKTIKKLLGGL
ncbi:MAG: DNA polymerase [Promethearchaeota archaeon]|nr:MAG: DNA polymerase [Candidatus Lokiarchaeota archaeon]